VTPSRSKRCSNPGKLSNSGIAIADWGALCPMSNSPLHPHGLTQPNVDAGFSETRCFPASVSSLKSARKVDFEGIRGHQFYRFPLPASAVLGGSGQADVAATIHFPDALSSCGSESCHLPAGFQSPANSSPSQAIASRLRRRLHVGHLAAGWSTADHIGYLHRPSSPPRSNPRCQNSRLHACGRRPRTQGRLLLDLRRPAAPARPGRRPPHRLSHPDPHQEDLPRRNHPAHRMSPRQHDPPPIHHLRCRPRLIQTLPSPRHQLSTTRRALPHHRLRNLCVALGTHPYHPSKLPPHPSPPTP